MNKYSRRSFSDFAQIFFDVIFVFVSFISAIFISFKNDYVNSIQENLWIFILFITFYLCIMLISGMYNYTTFVYHDRLLRRILLSSIFSYIFCYYLLTSIMEPNGGSKQFLIIFLLIVLLVLPSQRIVSHEIKKSSKNRWHNRVLLIGNCENIREYIYYLDKTSFHVNIIGYISTEENGKIPDQTEVGNLGDLPSILTSFAVDEVIFALHYSKIKVMESYIFLCEERDLIVRIAMDFSEMNSSRNYIHSIGTLPMLTFYSSSQSSLGKFVKRSFDLLGSVIGLVFLLIITIPISIVNLLFSGGQLFSTYSFITVNGRKFKLLQFSTEKKNKFSGFLAKTGIKSFPEIINVFTGDMSIVGTHPLSAAEIGASANSSNKLSLKPGMTGMWWLAKRKHIYKSDIIREIDDRYIDSWSLLRDAIILLETFLVLLFGKKRSHKDHYPNKK